MSGRSLSGPHIAWSAGHAIVVLASSYEIIKMVTFSSAPKAHSLALFGALISWGIVVFKAQGVPQPSKAYLQRLLLDENAQVCSDCQRSLNGAVPPSGHLLAHEQAYRHHDPALCDVLDLPYPCVVARTSPLNSQ